MKNKTIIRNRIKIIRRKVEIFECAENVQSIKVRQKGLIFVKSHLKNYNKNFMNYLNVKTKEYYANFNYTDTITGHLLRNYEKFESIKIRTSNNKEQNIRCNIQQMK